VLFGVAPIGKPLVQLSLTSVDETVRILLMDK
jgi:hypothetical protein